MLLNNFALELKLFTVFVVNNKFVGNKSDIHIEVL